MSRRARSAWCAGVFCLILFGTRTSADDVGLERRLVARGEAFVAAMNAPGDEALAAFAREHVESRVATSGATGRFVEAVRRDFAEKGPITHHALRVIDGGRLLFVYAQRAKSGAWQCFQFRVLHDDDDRLQLVFVSIAVEPQERPKSAVDAPETRIWLDRYVAELEKQQPFSGVVLLTRGGRELYSLVRGRASVGPDRPMTRQTELGMASGSKMFTAVSILQLAEAGKLSLDDTLAMRLPDFPRRDYAENVTLRKLLTHTAGAGDYWDDEYEKAWGGIVETRQMLPHVLRHLAPESLGRFQYSNSGFVLLGLVVEAVSGQNFYDYVAEHVFRPAGMKATGYPLRSQNDPQVARPYDASWSAGAVRPGVFVPVELGERGTAAGGAATTADDLVRFVRALGDGTLLDAASYRAMTSAQIPMSGPFGDASPGQSYGFGTIVEERGGVVSFGHGGTAPGTSFEFKVYPASDTVLVVMSNYNTIAAHEIAGALDEIVRSSRPGG